MRKFGERSFKKLIKNIAKLNPDYKFAYLDSYLVLDTNENIDIEEIDMPKGFIINSIMTDPGEPTKGSIIDSYGRGVGILFVDDLQNEENEEFYKDFIPVERKSVKHFVKDIKYNITHNNIKNRLTYTFSKSEKANKSNKTKTSVFGGIKKVKKTNKPKSNMFSNLKNRIAYTFSKSEKADITKKNPFANLKSKLTFKPGFLSGGYKKIKKNKPTVTTAPTIPAPTIPTPTIPAPTIPAPTIPAPTTPTTNTNSYVMSDACKKQLAEEYLKLGEYERMFVDDATAECLVPGDNEFDQMLNERTVNKEAILNYYSNIKSLKSVDKLQVRYNNLIKGLKYAYSNLDEYERMAVDDAMAENLEFGDNELDQLASERAVNKKKVLSYMQIYKGVLLIHKDIIAEYNTLNNKEVKDYGVLSINELRKELKNAVKKNRGMFTKPELEGQKTSTLKKDDIVKALTRVDTINLEREAVKELTYTK